MHKLLAPLDLKAGRKHLLLLSDPIRDAFKEGLLRLQEGKFYDSLQGVCINVGDHVAEVVSGYAPWEGHLMASMFVENYFDLEYQDTVVDGYGEAHENDALWEGEQLEARAELITFLLSELDNPINQRLTMTLKGN